MVNIREKYGNVQFGDIIQAYRSQSKHGTKLKEALGDLISE